MVVGQSSRQSSTNPQKRKARHKCHTFLELNPSYKKSLSQRAIGHYFNYVLSCKEIVKVRKYVFLANGFNVLWAVKHVFIFMSNQIKSLQPGTRLEAF
jgi:hypothetical protein